ncbi:MAG: AgmX/PglI C-terminal domain-containing protein [Labilithrix sp.]
MRRAALLSLLMLAACACGRSPAPRAPTPADVPTPAAAFAIDARAASPPAPIAIDSNDGSTLDLRELSINVTLHGAIAHTSIRARFVSPLDRQTEGRFRLVMPPRSSISRLAMSIGGRWREAEAAETSAARRTYEEIIHRRRDPLLIEQPREREIAARIAPIAPREEKEVALEYTTEIVSDRPFVVPLRGLPVVHELRVSVIDGATEPFHLETSDAQPTADVRYALPASSPRTTRSGDLVATRVRADIPAVPQPLDQTVYLVDTSASADLDAARALLDALPNAPIIAYDQTAAFLGQGQGARAALRARSALGLANLRAGLELARTSGARRVVILGGATSGIGLPLELPPHSQDPRRALDALDPIERIDVLGTVATVDAQALRPIARHGLVIEDALLLDRAELVRRLSHRVQDAPVTIPGATWQSTDRLASAAPGEERVVFARIDSSEPRLPALEHAVAASKAERLVARGIAQGWTEDAKREVIELAHAHRLATPFTSLIVLEDDADVTRLKWIEAEPHASSLPAPSPAPRPVTPGPGTGHRTTAVSMRVASVVVSGRLPPEVIQRIVRLHAGAFQACYLDGQRRDPGLAGRVTVKFVIQRDGTVARAQDGGSEIGDQKVIECMVHAFSGLEFPVPEGGVVTVTYPFMLSPGAPEPPRPLSLHLLRSRFGRSPFEDAFTPPPAPWSEAYTQMREDPTRAPLTPIGLIALGAALEARGDRERAARAYTSLVELWPERAELARAAAVRLDRLGDPLAVPLLRRAAAERPDQPSGHHLLGLALLRAGDREGARAAFEAGLGRRYELRYAGAEDLLRADLALLEPSSVPLTRLSLTWETDTSDLDVVVTNDANERRAAAPIAWAGDGYGPEVVDPARGEDVTHVQVALHRRGMGGDVLGAVHVIKRNERGDVTVEPRPFEIMTEKSVIDLGKY